MENCYYNMVYENRVTIESIKPNPFSPNENEIKKLWPKIFKAGFLFGFTKGVWG